VNSIDRELKLAQEYIAHIESMPENLLPKGYWDWEVSMPGWNLDRLIPERSIGMVYGASNSGKSHLICDYVMAHLRGDDYWQGHALSAGDVIMFSESHGHIKARLKAYRSHHGKAIVNNIVTLPTKSFEVSEIESLGRWLAQFDSPPMLLIFDTLATAFQFEENDNQQASRMIKLIEDNLLPSMHRLGTIMIIHHTSKASEGKTARGASALIGNIDYSINVWYDDDLNLTMAKWEKDRWRLKDAPMWSGTASRVPVSFTNGQAEQTVLDWEDFSEDQVETVKQLRQDVKLDAMKAKVAESIKSHPGPIYIHTNNRSRVPNGCSPFRINELVPNSKWVQIMVEYIKDSYEYQTVFTPRGTECGINVVAAEFP